MILLKKYLCKGEKRSYSREHESCLNRPKLECVMAQVEEESKQQMRRRWTLSLPNGLSVMRKKGKSGNKVEKICSITQQCGEAV